MRTLSKPSSQFQIAMVFFFCLGCLVATRFDVESVTLSSRRELLAPPKDLQYFTFGYREAIADMLWLRSIQDFDFCEKVVRKDLCQGRGWLYQMLDLITDLSPKFHIAYSAGAIALTIIISDIEGASKLFDKAVINFPDDWRLLYKAAYHAIYEEKNKAKAAVLVERAARLGAPEWVYSLAANLYTESGQKTIAIKLIEELEATGRYNPRILNRMRKKVGLPEVPVPDEENTDDSH